MVHTVVPADRTVASAPADADAGRAGLVISLDGVAVTIRRTPVLRGVDLQLQAGEVLGVLGANGSGKTTLLRLLATLVAPSAGRGVVLGHELGNAGCVAARPQISLIGHLPALYPQLSLAENLRFVARLTGRDESLAQEALVTVGLAGAAQRRAENCSQGMQRRAELARVLLTRPTLLLLDEIHAGLDHDSAGLVDEIVARVRGRGGACVLISHEPHRLTALVDRMVRVADGRTHPVATTTRASGRQW